MTGVTSAEPGDDPGIDPLAALEASAVGRAVLVDVRSEAEWVSGHVASAIHVPLDEIPGADITDDRVLVTICGGGGRAARAAEALRARGLDARPMTGGLRAWVAAGLPVDGAGPGGGPTA